MTPPFERTVCDCDEDRENCRTRPGYALLDDIARIGKELTRRGITFRLEDWFQAGRGWTLAARENDRIRIIKVPAMVPKRAENGHCVFLTEEGRCSVHAVAPFGCAYFDVHMSKEEGDRRSLWALARVRPDLKLREAKGENA